MFRSTSPTIQPIQRQGNTTSTALVTPLLQEIVPVPIQTHSNTLPECSRLHSSTHLSRDPIQQLKKYYPFSRDKQSESELYSAWIVLDEVVTSIEQLGIEVQEEIIQLVQAGEPQQTDLDIEAIKKKLKQAKQDCQTWLVEQVKTMNITLSNAPIFSSNLDITHFLKILREKNAFLTKQLHERQIRASSDDNQFTKTTMAIEDIDARLVGLDCAKLSRIATLREELKEHQQKVLDTYKEELKAICQLNSNKASLERFELYFRNALFLSTHSNTSLALNEGILPFRQLVFCCMVAGKACGFYRDIVSLDSESKERYVAVDQANTRFDLAVHWLDEALEITSEVNQPNDNLLYELSQMALNLKIDEAQKECQFIEKWQKELATKCVQLDHLIDLSRQSIREFNQRILREENSIQQEASAFLCFPLKLDRITDEFNRRQLELSAQLALANKEYTEIVEKFGNFSLKEKYPTVLEELRSQSQHCFAAKAELITRLDGLKKKTEEKQQNERVEEKKRELQTYQLEQQAREALFSLANQEDQEAYDLSKKLIDEHIPVLRLQLLELFHANLPFRQTLGENTFPNLNRESHKIISNKVGGLSCTLKIVDDSRCDADKVMNEIDRGLAQPGRDWSSFLCDARNKDASCLIEQKFLKYSVLKQIQNVMNEHKGVAQFITDERTAIILTDPQHLKTASEFCSTLQGRLKWFWQWLQGLFSEAKTKQCINPLLKCSFFRYYCQTKSPPLARQHSAVSPLPQG